MLNRRNARLLALALLALGSPPALATVPEILLPVASVAEAIEQAKPQPLRYAVEQALHLDLRNGDWDEPEPGLARWRLQLRSPGARTLSATLQNLRLPPGAELWFYDPAAGGDRQGPLLPDADGRLWTPFVRAETALLEIRVPATDRAQVTLSLLAAEHGYRNPLEGPQPKGAFGDADSCNINVACPEGNTWRPEIRSAVLLTVGGGTLCSGTLVNNVLQDNRALILTANHCGVRSTNVTSTRAYFNVQKTGCSSTADGRVDQNLAGRTFLARDAESDFTLFALASTPSSAFNVYYAGWNASSAIPQSGVTIHHPSGDDKKISVYTSPAQRADDVRIGTFGGFTVDAWQITWSRGTTEGGSSGAGLWNQDRQLVGILSGGSASCSNTTASDFFARFERGWLANPATNGQLKAHLDPTNSGCLAIAGKEPSGAAVNACTGGGSGGGGNTGDGGALGSSGGAMGLGVLMLLAGGALWQRRRAAPKNS